MGLASRSFPVWAAAVDSPGPAGEKKKKGIDGWAGRIRLRTGDRGWEDGPPKLAAALLLARGAAQVSGGAVLLDQLHLQDGACLAEIFGISYRLQRRCLPAVSVGISCTNKGWPHQEEACMEVETLPY